MGDGRNKSVVQTHTHSANVALTVLPTHTHHKLPPALCLFPSLGVSHPRHGPFRNPELRTVHQKQRQHLRTPRAGRSSLRRRRHPLQQLADILAEAGTPEAGSEPQRTETFGAAQAPHHSAPKLPTPGGSSASPCYHAEFPRLSLRDYRGPVSEIFFLCLPLNMIRCKFSRRGRVIRCGVDMNPEYFQTVGYFSLGMCIASSAFIPLALSM